MVYLRNYESATREEIEKILGTKKVTTILILNEMVKRNMIKKEGKSRNIIYKRDCKKTNIIVI